MLCLSRVLLLITSHGHQHHYGTDDIPADENRLTLYAVNCELQNAQISGIQTTSLVGLGLLGPTQTCCASFVVARIRSKFPSDDYTGHEFPPPTP